MVSGAFFLLVCLDLMAASTEDLEPSGVSLYISTQLSKRSTFCSIEVTIAMDMIDMQCPPIIETASHTLTTETVEQFDTSLRCGVMTGCVVMESAVTRQAIVVTAVQIELTDG